MGEKFFMRASGVLLPVFCLPSDYGIGCFSKEAYTFVDFLAEAKQTYWQVLPMGPTSYGDSPYQSFSTFAGNPYFVDLHALIEKGWLTQKEVGKVNWGEDLQKIDYEKLYKNRMKMFMKAYHRSGIAADKDYCAFVKKNAFWLEDYALFYAIKDANKGKSFIEWDDALRLHKKAALKAFAQEEKHAELMGCVKFVQYLFYTQWKALKQYANEKGVQIIGDIPIYVAFDSADTWAEPKLFQLDTKGYPTGVAGCPPDYFAATGQLWGNPLYDWEYHKKTGYAWWIRRMEACFELYDVVRIDHFRGFDEYYNVPYRDKTAEFGHWVKGPGYDLFAAMKKKLGERKIIAEDLGLITPGVQKLVKKTGYPGMKVLELAFDSNEDNDHLPHNFERNCVVYTGTHDNDTTVGWFGQLNRKDQAYTKKYLNIKNAKHIAWDLVRLAMGSVADTVIIQMQDYLELGNEARINVPSTLGNNWNWRMQNDVCTGKLADQIRELTELYGRGNAKI